LSSFTTPASTSRRGFFYLKRPPNQHEYKARKTSYKYMKILKNSRIQSSLAAPFLLPNAHSDTSVRSALAVSFPRDVRPSAGQRQRATQSRRAIIAWGIE
jgi:hypothetical protein